MRLHRRIRPTACLLMGLLTLTAISLLLFDFTGIWKSASARFLRLRQPDYRARMFPNIPPGSVNRGLHVRPRVSTDGVRPPVSTDGVRPPVSTDGVRHPVSTDGVRPPVFTDGVRPPVSTDGVRPPMSTDGVRPPVFTDGPRATERETAPASTTKQVSSPPTTPEVDRHVYMHKYENLVFDSRREAVDKACSRIQRQNSEPCEEKALKDHLLQTNGDEITFCPIEKAGSTFWKRILHIVGGWGNDTNPQSIATRDADTQEGGFRTLTNSSLEEVEDSFNESTSIMFVRDPYTKLFSGWLDKFFSTNPYYWQLYGRRIIMRERRNYTKHSWACGHDVTFAEFLNFTLREIKNKPCVERHFAPNYNHCFPCNLTFDYIGKYETLKSDTMFLLEKLNLKHRVTFDNFENDAVGNAIKDSVEWIYRKKPEITSCIYFRCGLFRVWKRLQSRGIIGIDAKFPIITNQEADDLDAQTFEDMLMYAHEHSNKDRLKNNRHEAIAEAFNNLKIDLRNRVKETFRIDFEMFGYDSEPDYFRIPPSSEYSYFGRCPADGGSMDTELLSHIDLI